MEKTYGVSTLCELSVCPGVGEVSLVVVPTPECDVSRPGVTSTRGGPRPPRSDIETFRQCRGHRLGP